jgi:hypothetical protein
VNLVCSSCYSLQYLRCIHSISSYWIWDAKEVQIPNSGVFLIGIAVLLLYLLIFISCKSPAIILNKLKFFRKLNLICTIPSVLFSSRKQCISVLYQHIYNSVKINNWNLDGTTHCIGLNGNRPFRFDENINSKDCFCPLPSNRKLSCAVA